METTNRVLAFQSLLALFVAATLPLIGRIQGETSEVSSTLPLLFAGLIGMAAYLSISQATKRLDELEKKGQQK